MTTLDKIAYQDYSTGLDTLFIIKLHIISAQLIIHYARGDDPPLKIFLAFTALILESHQCALDTLKKYIYFGVKFELMGVPKF